MSDVATTEAIVPDKKRRRRRGRYDRIIETSFLRLYSNGITSVSATLQKAYENFFNYEFTIVKHCNPNVNFNVVKYIAPEKKNYTEALRISVPTLYEALTSCVTGLSCPDTAKYVNLILKSQYEVHTIHTFSMTSSLCSDGGNTYVIMPGYAVDLNDYVDKWWFEGMTLEPAVKERYMGLVNTFTNGLLRITRRLTKLKLDRSDTSVLILLSVCKFAEEDDEKYADLQMYKDRVIREWSHSMQKKYKEDACRRMREIMLLYNEITAFRLEAANIDLQFQALRATGAKIPQHIPCIQTTDTQEEEIKGNE
ncbi:unnamed protein product [Bursaphelenchus xylophilus]|uniref:(pine wood nematode) hypothetical protein n=1 Tax=Bursaphelenchus xylophilus TaxID=6326 RepID=A0A1I7RQF2_BURXY|nr:unnamed protein product [Bursaphelenchus xylophilus]CAG9104479.1 unnamed protein product [Bursaphelenchus xylophilus]